MSTASASPALSAPAASPSPALPASLFEFVLLPFLQAEEELAMRHAIQSSSRLQACSAVAGALGSNSATASSSCAAAPNSFREISVSAFQSPAALLRRSLQRATAAMRQCAACDDAHYRTLDQARLESEFPGEQVWIDDLTVSQLLNRLAVASSPGSDARELWKPISESPVCCMPLAWNLPVFFSDYIESRYWRRLPETAEEEKYTLPYKSNSFQQLACGLVLPALTLLQIRGAVDASSTGDEAAKEAAAQSLSSSAASASAVVHATLSSLHPVALLHFPLAVSRLLSLTNLMRAEGCVYTYCMHPPHTNTNTAYQLHPFLVRWPTDRAEWSEAMRTHFTEFAATAAFAEIEAEDAAAANCCCNGATNPDPALSPADLEVAMHGSADADGSNYKPALSDRWNEFQMWQCDRVCPPSHCDPRNQTCVCPHHLHRFRGCLWWNCARGMDVSLQLLARMIGLKPQFCRTLQLGYPRAGKRTDWQMFFQRAPPFVHHISSELMKDVSPAVSSALSSTLQWSLAAVVACEAECVPSPAFLAAPIAPGWIGGFMAAANRDSH